MNFVDEFLKIMKKITLYAILICSFMVSINAQFIPKKELPKKKEEPKKK